MVDIILILVLAAFGYFGWKRGFIKNLLSLSSTVISFILSIVLYKPISKIISQSPWGESVRETMVVEVASTVVINTISFIVIIILSKIIIAILAKLLNVASKVPGVKQANEILGMVLGIASGLLICYIVIGVMKNVSAEETVRSIENSWIAVMFYDNNIISNVLSKFIK